MAESIIPRIGRPPLLSILSDNLLCDVCLFVNDVVIADTLTLADLTEATFGGYARVRVGHWTPAVDDDGVAACWGDPALFTYNTVGPGQTVRGYYLLEAPGGALLGVWKADGAGFTFVDGAVGHTRLIVIPRLNLRREQI